MKITYEFNTDDEGFSYQDLHTFQQAGNMACALGKIKDIIRDWLKYNTAPIVNEWSSCWDKYSEEEKQFYKEHPTPDVERMSEEILDAITDYAHVDMEKMGY